MWNAWTIPQRLCPGEASATSACHNCEGSLQKVGQSSSMPQLVELSLGHAFNDSGHQGVNDNSLLKTLSAHTQIRRLHLHRCNEVTHDGLQLAIQKLPKLEELDVYETLSLEDIRFPRPEVQLDLELLRDSHPNKPYVHRRGRFADKHWMELIRSAGTYKE